MLKEMELPNERFSYVETKFSNIEFSRFWQAFKTFKSEREFQVADGADLQEENSKLYERLLKVFLHPPPPLERESVVRSVGLTVLEVTILSIAKMGL